MSDHHPNYYHRRSIRLKGYDYSKAGLYFITMCVQNRDCLFGEIHMVGADLRVCLDISEIQDDIVPKGKGTHEGMPRQKLPRQKMILNDAGAMIEKWYNELENKYPDIRCHEMVVMPNHFHCIVEITGKYDNHQGDCDIHSGAHVGAPLRGRPDDPIADPDHDPINQPKYGPDNKKFGATICDIVDWFKTMTTNEYIRGVKNLGWKRFDGKLWQRNYWDNIIQNEESYYRISEYISQNSTKWNNDQLNPDQQI